MEVVVNTHKRNDVDEGEREREVTIDCWGRRTHQIEFRQKCHVEIGEETRNEIRGKGGGVLCKTQSAKYGCCVQNPN